MRQTRVSIVQQRSPGLSSITFSNLGLQDISLFTCEASNAATNEEGEVVVISEDAHLYVMGKYM